VKLLEREKILMVSLFDFIHLLVTSPCASDGA